MGAAGPWATHSAPWARVVRASAVHLHGGQPGHLVLLLLAYAVSILNRSCMWLEDRLVPSLAEVKFDRVVFILGHHRSGTTNLHKELRQHPDCTAGTMLDLLFPSLFLNRLVRSRPAQWALAVLDRGVRTLWNTSSHSIGFDEELEEHLWLLHLVRSEALFIMFPELIRATSRAEFENALSVSEEDVRFLQRCLRRVIHARTRGAGASPLYLARPLILTRDHALLRRAFPGAKIILCVREPAAAIRSHAEMTRQQIRCDVDDPRLVRWARFFYEACSRDQYRAMLEMLEDESLRGQLLPIPFARLQRDTPGALRDILSFLDVPPADLTPVRSESHRRAAVEVPSIIPADVIEQDLGEVWRLIEARLRSMDPE